MPFDGGPAEQAIRTQQVQVLGPGTERSTSIAGAIIETRAMHPREAVRALADRLLEETGGELSDDATLLCLDWHGGHGRSRDGHHGADETRASQPLAGI